MYAIPNIDFKNILKIFNSGREQKTHYNQKTVNKHFCWKNKKQVLCAIPKLKKKLSAYPNIYAKCHCKIATTLRYVIFVI